MRGSVGYRVPQGEEKGVGNVEASYCVQSRRRHYYLTSCIHVLSRFSCQQIHLSVSHHVGYYSNYLNHHFKYDGYLNDHMMATYLR